MTLNIKTEEDDQRQLLMTIEVPEERVQKQMRQTARKIGRDVAIPGFRRGKVPYQVLIKRVGAEALRQEAVDGMVQNIFEEAMKEIEPDISAKASFDEMELEPLVLKFTVPLTPEVDLGEYRELRQDVEPVEVKDEAVEEALQAARDRHQVVEEVDRAVEAGDVVTIAGTGELIVVDDAEDVEDEEGEEEDEDTAVSDDDTMLFDTESMELLMDSEKLFPNTPFVDNIVGMNIGDEKEFEFTFPEDFEDDELAGKDALFSISVLVVKNRDLPELDDELAIEEGHESLDDMRESTRKNLVERAQQQAQNDLIEETITTILEGATLVYPPAAIETEIDNRIESFKEQVTKSGWEWDDYLKLQGGSDEGLRDDFKEAATEAVEHQLVIREFIFAEKLTIEEEDIDAHLDKQFSDLDDELNDNMRDFYRQGYGLEMISSQILMDKVYGRMTAVFTGEAPTLEELEAAAKAKEEAAAQADEETTEESIPEEVETEEEFVETKVEEAESEEEQENPSEENEDLKEE